MLLTALSGLMVNDLLFLFTNFFLGMVEGPLMLLLQGVVPPVVIATEEQEANPLLLHWV